MYLLKLIHQRVQKGGDVGEDPEEKEMVVIDERRKEKPF